MNSVVPAHSPHIGPLTMPELHCAMQLVRHDIIQRVPQNDIIAIPLLGDPAGGKQRITLNSSDKIYAELRDLSFAAVGPQLRQRAMAIQSDYNTSKVIK